MVQTTSNLVRDAIVRLGLSEVAKRLELSRETVLRVASGVSSRKGSVALAEKNLGRLAEGA